eukprot:scaffold4726_cov128-Cylindrotheca_fusiformis.AAC.4
MHYMSQKDIIIFLPTHFSTVPVEHVRLPNRNSMSSNAQIKQSILVAFYYCDQLPARKPIKPQEKNLARLARLSPHHIRSQAAKRYYTDSMD